MKSKDRQPTVYVNRKIARAKAKEPLADMMLRISDGGGNPRRYYRASVDDPTLVKGRPTPIGRFLGGIGRMTGLFQVEPKED